MKAAKTIVLAIFNRLGDGVISAAACAEFIRRWSCDGRRFLVVTSPQLYPYVTEICRTAEVMVLNRKNPLDWGRLAFKRFWSYRGFDIGLNPYSFGKESRRIARMGRWSATYSSTCETFFTNYYDRVRAYLGMPIAGDFAGGGQLPKMARHVLVCPESSESRRSMSDAKLHAVLSDIRKRWPEAKIVVAARLPVCGLYEADFLALKKSETSSLAFINVMRRTDLFVGVDSGPLHIAMALKIPVIAYFSSAYPATVIDRSATVWALRASALSGVYCEKLDCCDPVCMAKLGLNERWQLSSEPTARTIVRSECPYITRRQ